MFPRVSLLIALLLCLGVVDAQVQRDAVKEQLIEDELTAVAPAAVADFKAGTAAMDADDHAQAAKFFQAVLKQAPDFNPAMRRLGLSLAESGYVEDGMALVEDALSKKRSPENLISVAGLLAYRKDRKVTDEQRERAYTLALEAEHAPKVGADEDYEVMLADLALKQNHDDVFRSTTNKLIATYPELMQTHYYNALLQAYDENWSVAENEIKRAESLGLPHEAVQEFLDSGVHKEVLIRRWAWYSVFIVLAWVAGLLALFLLGKLLSARTLTSIENANPNEIATRSALSLRTWYRRLINVGGVYYYLSYPFVIVLVVGIAGGLIYMCFMVGRIPIKLVAIVCIGALVTVYSMVKSLFIKIESEDPGRPLTHDEAPALWELTKSVARAVETRPVDEIRLTPGTDLAVYENGSRREKANDSARRILILGVGVLNDFQQSAFRAVLAHEYGHFSHRDTAGGDVALRVNQDMIKFARAMAMHRQNVNWNAAFQFLRLYHFIFRRLSHGATRLQEVLADRVAAAKFGADAFEQGLRHVIRKSAEFEFVANKEIRESASARRALMNLYELETTANPDVEAKADEALNRVTSEDDTHPCPTDRFRLTRKVLSQSEPPISGMVWDLFQNRAALTLEMTTTIQARMPG